MNVKQTIVMFDLDGTLFDTAQAIPLAFNSAFREIGFSALDPHMIKETIGLPLEKAFSFLMSLPPTDLTISLLVEEYQR